MEVLWDGPETGMRYFNPASDTRAFILDHYTGVGEVLAIHQLDRLFYLFNRQLRVKRGALFSLDDAKNNDLIFVGSPSENLTLADISRHCASSFSSASIRVRAKEISASSTSTLKRGSRRYFSLHPQISPPPRTMRSSAFFPVSIHRVRYLILAGNSTFGTQAAVEYVCREDSIKELLQRLKVSKDSDLKPFEALLHVKIAHGVPVMTDLVSVRNRSN